MISDVLTDAFAALDRLETRLAAECPALIAECLDDLHTLSRALSVLQARLAVAPEEEEAP